MIWKQLLWGTIDFFLCLKFLWFTFIFNTSGPLSRYNCLIFSYDKFRKIFLLDFLDGIQNCDHRIARCTNSSFALLKLDHK